MSHDPNRLPAGASAGLIASFEQQLGEAKVIVDHLRGLANELDYINGDPTAHVASLGTMISEIMELTARQTAVIAALLLIDEAKGQAGV